MMETPASFFRLSVSGLDPRNCSKQIIQNVTTYLCPWSCSRYHIVYSTLLPAALHQQDSLYRISTQMEPIDEDEAKRRQLEDQEQWKKLTNDTQLPVQDEAVQALLSRWLRTKSLDARKCADYRHFNQARKASIFLNDHFPAEVTCNVHLRSL